MGFSTETRWVFQKVEQKAMKLEWSMVIHSETSKVTHWADPMGLMKVISLVQLTVKQKDFCLAVMMVAHLVSLKQPLSVLTKEVQKDFELERNSAHPWEICLEKPKGSSKGWSMERSKALY